MVTQLSTETAPAPERVGHLCDIWLVVMQIVTLVLLALALHWSISPETHLPPAAIYRKFLALLALVLLVVSLAPKWRHGEIAGLLCGVTLATASWLSAGHVLSSLTMQRYISSSEIPYLTPIVLLIAVLALLSGLLLRTGIFGESRVGIGALAAGLLLSGWTLFFYGLLHKVAEFKLPEFGYGFSPDQMQEILASVILFSLTLWLGGVGIRRQGRWAFQTIGMVIVLIIFLLKWHYSR